MANPGRFFMRHRQGVCGLLWLLLSAAVPMGGVLAQVRDSLPEAFRKTDSLLQRRAVPADTALLLWNTPTPDTSRNGTARRDSAHKPPAQGVAPAAAGSKPGAKPRRWHVLGAPSRPAWRRLRNQWYKLPDTTQLARTDSLALDRLHRMGYPEAVRDSLMLNPQEAVVHYVAGPFYEWGHVEADSVPAPLLHDAQLDRQTGKAFSWQALGSSTSFLLREYENRGFPFARVSIKKVDYVPLEAQHLRVDLQLSLDPGPWVALDSVRFVGNARENTGFLLRVAGLRSGERFSRQNLENGVRLLNNSIYYQNARLKRVIFRGNTAVAEIELARKKSNRFDALFGLLPPREAGQKLDFTALVDVQLVSAFRWGELLKLKYEKLQSTSQSLDLGYVQPFLLGSPFQVDLKFYLLKQDSTFLVRRFEPGVGYRLSRNLNARIYFRNERSSLLNPEPFSSLKWPPPPVLDAQTNMGGLALMIDRVDNQLNPGKGWMLETDAAYGQKTIRPTRGLDSLDYSRLNLKQPRTEVTLNLQLFVPSFRQQVLVLATRNYWLQLDDFLDNDQRFVGGARSLRGFNENEFLTRLYSIWTLEYRLRLGSSSYIGAFADAGYLEYGQGTVLRPVRPVGLGVALSLRTPAGQLSLSYALGQVEDRPFQPTRGRVHLGLINTF